MALVAKSLPANPGDMRPGFEPSAGKILWRRSWQPTQSFLPGDSPGQRSLEGSSPWGHKELDMTERLSMHVWVCVD